MFSHDQPNFADRHIGPDADAVAEATDGAYQNVSTSTSPELSTAITTFLG